MKKAPHIYQRFVNRGDFTVRKSDGKNNGVSPDMILEQTYNADLKQKGLTGITMNEKAENKWLYTKAVLAAVSSKFKYMLNPSPKEKSS